MAIRFTLTSVVAMRWAFAVLLGWKTLVGAIVLADDLRGRVLDAQGKPIANARIDISTARPKVGKGIFCPSCYRDCAKFARSNEEGFFELKALDPTLTFRLVATAVGKKATATAAIDPAAGVATIAMQEFPGDLPPHRILRGVVRSELGAPVPGALVEPVGAKTADRSFRGEVAGAEPAVTDDNGEFQLPLASDLLGIDVEVTAEGFSGAVAQLLAPGETRHEIQTPSGAAIRGELLHHGKPAANVPVAVVQLNRGGDGVFRMAIPGVSEGDGIFEFSSLLANEFYAIYTPVEAGSIGPVVPTRIFKVAENGSTHDLGAIELAEPVSFSGIVKTTDGAAIPETLSLSLERLPAWDQITVAVESDGRFQIENLPPETYEIELTDTDFVLAEAMDARHHLLGARSFGVRLDASLADLEIAIRRLAEGETLGPTGAEERLPRNATGDQTLSGVVVDLEGNPVGGVRIHARRRNALTPLSSSATSHSDGRFTLSKLPDVPLDLSYRDPKDRGYPVGSAGVSLIYVGFARPQMNQTDIRLVFDANLAKRPEELNTELSRP